MQIMASELEKLVSLSGAAAILLTYLYAREKLRAQPLDTTRSLYVSVKSQIPEKNG